jgi:hypothetical protein
MADFTFSAPHKMPKTHTHRLTNLGPSNPLGHDEKCRLGAAIPPTVAAPETDLYGRASGSFGRL